MNLVLPYPPTLNHLRAIVRGRMVKTAEARRYEARVQSEAVKQGARLLVGPVSVVVRAYRPRRIGDLDNALKALFDSLKGIAWNDDSQVVHIEAHRFDDKDRPRVELEIRERGAA
jgi:crossover junction endodeoxyribonuclease RusA